ncbi:MAG: ATP-binding protein [Cyanobacteria bacterium P01_D01_bin.73]
MEELRYPPKSINYPDWSRRLRGKWRRYRRSLSFKLTLLITGIVAASVGGTTVFFMEREQRGARVELQNEATLLLNSLEISLRKPLYNLDSDFLEEFMESLGKDKSLVVFGAAYDGEGRLIADTTRTSAAFQIDSDPEGAKLVQSSVTRMRWEHSRLVVGRAFVTGGTPFGAIQIALATDSLEHELEDIRNRGLAIIAFSPLLGILLAQWVSRHITRPIQHLVKGTRQLARGNFDELVTIETNDELEILAQSFNQMVIQLRDNLMLLETNNQDLEAQTKTLTQALKELGETQGQLIQSEKMSSLGQLVAGIAHEVNNPVNFVHGNLRYLRDYWQSTLELINIYERNSGELPSGVRQEIENIDLAFIQDDMDKILHSMDLGTTRIRDIVLSLRNFSRLDEATQKCVDIHDGIDSTLMILQHRLKANSERPEIQIKADYDELPGVICHPGLLNQVFMNLLSNAIDALEEYSARRSPEERKSNPGIIEISTKHCSESNPSSVVIEIQDNGPGIKDGAGLKLFDPFFTTKPVGKGTGLGLSISYRIITDQHRGKLNYRSAPGEGTTFVIEIPTLGTEEFGA